MYSNNDYRNYLSHHGVIGMHWGIRRFQPYGEGYIRKDGKTGKVLKKLNNNSIKSRKTQYSVRENQHERIHSLSASGNERKREEADQIFEVDKWTEPTDKYLEGEFNNKFEDIACQATRHLRNSGIKTAINYFKKEMDGHAYRIEFVESKDKNEPYVGFSLKVEGKKYGYSTSGDDTYTDDQYFYRLKH